MPAPKPHPLLIAVPRRLPMVALLAMLGCGGQPAAPVDPADLPPTDVTAAEVLDRLVSAYRDTPGYYDNAEYRESFLRQGENVLIEPPPHQVSVAFERPNRFRLTRRVPEVNGPELEVVVASAGETLTATVSDLAGQTLARPAPETLSAAAIAPDPALREALLPVPLENLFPQFDLLTATEENPPRLLADADATLLANRETAGRPCHRVRLAREGGEYVLWIDQETSTLRRVDVPTVKLREQLDPQGVMLDWRLWIDLREATLGADIASSVFSVAAEEGAETVEAFTVAE